jgi:hydrogenase expression/formation protein HypE
MQITGTRTMDENVKIGHGSGGKLSRELIQGIFYKYFDNDKLLAGTDSACFEPPGGTMCYTTDSYVVEPVFFPGGNIGKLAVCGTVNDLAVAGATPMYLSTGFILEEGFPMEELENIVKTMKEEADKAGVQIITGDTKVVGKGKCDKVFINTSGVGVLIEGAEHIASGEKICHGDKIIVNGTIGDHGITVLSARGDLGFSTAVKSDCASLNGLFNEIKDFFPHVHFARDATRGGLASVMNEMVDQKNYGALLQEDQIPVKEEITGACELLGFDPLHVANEGKIILVVAEDQAPGILDVMRKHPLGTESQIIGEITSTDHGIVVLETLTGGSRVINMLAGEQLPRIC